VLRAVGGGHGRNKRSITTRTSSCGHRPEHAPAAGAKMRNGIICQRRATHHTFNREEKPSGTTEECWNRRKSGHGRWR
jgi:hypothetical protein